jgi:hypothetical protein
MVNGVVFTTLHFLVTYKWTLKARVLGHTRLERIAKGKHSSLLGILIIHYKENLVL